MYIVGLTRIVSGPESEPRPRIPGHRSGWVRMLQLVPNWDGVWSVAGLALWPYDVSERGGPCSVFWAHLTFYLNSAKTRNSESAITGRVVGSESVYRRAVCWKSSRNIRTKLIKNVRLKYFHFMRQLCKYHYYLQVMHSYFTDTVRRCGPMRFVGVHLTTRY